MGPRPETHPQLHGRIFEMSLFEPKLSGLIVSPSTSVIITGICREYKKIIMTLCAPDGPVLSKGVSKSSVRQGKG